jgi:hypothetical protein
VFPGTYTVTLDSAFVSLEKPYVYTTNDGGNNKEYVYEIDKGAQSALVDFSTKFMDDCYAAGPDSRADNCINWKSFYGDITDVVWSIDAGTTPALAYSSGTMTVNWKDSYYQTVTYLGAPDIFGDKNPGSQEISDTFQITPTLKDDKIAFEIPESNETHDNDSNYSWQ